MTYDTNFACISLQSDYEQLVSELIASQDNDLTQQRLRAAFAQLTEGVELSAARAHKIKFRNNFEEFIAEVRGFLHVK